MTMLNAKFVTFLILKYKFNVINICQSCEHTCQLFIYIYMGFAFNAYKVYIVSLKRFGHWIDMHEWLAIITVWERSPSSVNLISKCYPNRLNKCLL